MSTRLLDAAKAMSACYVAEIPEKAANRPEWKPLFDALAALRAAIAEVGASEEAVLACGHEVGCKVSSGSCARCAVGAVKP